MLMVVSCTLLCGIASLTSRGVFLKKRHHLF